MLNPEPREDLTQLTKSEARNLYFSQQESRDGSDSHLSSTSSSHFEKRKKTNIKNATITRCNTFVQ